MQRMSHLKQNDTGSASSNESMGPVAITGWIQSKNRRAGGDMLPHSVLEKSVVMRPWRGTAECWQH